MLVVGLVAYALPEAFNGLDVTIIRGEPEQLLWKLDSVLEATTRTVDVGSVRELDQLPFPDWSLFGPSKFRIGYDFTRFPTGLIQQSRGCTFTCNYCPYIVVEKRHAIPNSGERVRGIAARHQDVPVSLVQVPRSVVRFGSQTCRQTGRTHREATAQDRVLHRKPDRLTTSRDTADVARGGADQHHRRHRNAR